MYYILFMQKINNNNIWHKYKAVSSFLKGETLWLLLSFDQ